MSNTSPKKVFIAGASGAVGRILCKLLLEDGWHVTGMTRSADKAADLATLGVDPVVVDVFDKEALVQAVGRAAPCVVIHQLTDLPKEFSPENMAAARPRNARIREEGTANLIAAALNAGAKRLVAQSVAFFYAPGPQPFAEEDPLDASTVPSVIKLEELVSGSGLEGVVLRYGRFYGPGTWSAVASETPVHVEAAADAARRAASSGKPGIYNIAEDDGTVSLTKARRELNWNPHFRI